MRPLFALLSVLAALIAGLQATPARGPRNGGETPAIQGGSLRQAADGWAPHGVTTPVVAAAPYAGRLPAVSASAATRFRVEARRFSRELALTVPHARRTPSIAWRRHVPRMDSGEPPGSDLFAT